MPGVKNILIIVNAAACKAFKLLKIPNRSGTSWLRRGEIMALPWRHATQRRNGMQRSVNHGHGWFTGVSGLWIVFQGSFSRIVLEDRSPSPDGWIVTMPRPLERIVWMPSPPLVPDDAPIDMAHLGRMTLGDTAVEREVLAMFAAQACDLADRLAVMPADAAALVHTLKGSARAIGAFRVADAAVDLEHAIRDARATATPIQALRAAVAEARGAIDAILKRS
jgi:HPt (histidine-containing phosphotransfer) domain-containing protein